jgi:hypothetical protein
MPESGILNRPGSGWDRLAAAVAGAMPASEIEAVWLFRTLRREGTEWGTALVARVDGEERERRRIYTARFQHVLKGKERGKFEWALEEVGAGRSIPSERSSPGFANAWTMTTPGR